VKRITVVVVIAMLLAACSEDVNTIGRMATSPGSIGTGMQRILVGVTDLSTGR
jgi:hypothetical protein